MPNDFASRVRAARLRSGDSVAKAARKARIDRVTWKRIEDGKNVQDIKLFKALDSLGIIDSEGVPTAEAEPALTAAGEFMAALREALGWSREDLAAKLHVGPQSIEEWEQGADVPRTVGAALARLVAPPAPPAAPIPKQQQARS